MTIAIGDTIPTANLMVMGESGPGGVSTSELFDGKKVLLLERGSKEEFGGLAILSFS